MPTGTHQLSSHTVDRKRNSFFVKVRKVVDIATVRGNMTRTICGFSPFAINQLVNARLKVWKPNRIANSPSM
jgi:hypothetical protein